MENLLKHADHNVSLARRNFAGARDSWLAAAREYYKSAGMTLHAKACAMAYTWQDYGVCEKCDMNVSACECDDEREPTCDCGCGCYNSVAPGRGHCKQCLAGNHIADESGQGVIDLAIGLAVVSVIFIGMVLLFGQYHQGDWLAYLPH